MKKVTLHNKAYGASFQGFFKEKQLRIGRRENNDLIILYPDISRVHCEIYEVEDGYQIKDLESTLGTSVNKQKLADKISNIKPGDILGLGSHQFDFTITEVSLFSYQALKQFLKRFSKR